MPDIINRRSNLAPYGLLLLAVWLAWSPTIARHLPLADDYTIGTMLDRGLRVYLQETFATAGVWRILGFIMIGPMASNGGYLPSVVLVTAHTLVVCLFYAVSLNLFRHRVASLTIALIFGVYPFCAGAVIWTSASMVVFVLGLMLANMLVLQRAGHSRGAQMRAFAVCAGLSLVASLVQENLVFAFAASGLLAWSGTSKMGPREWRRLAFERPAVFGPAAGSLAYLVLYWAFQTDRMLKPFSFHLAALISPYARQYSMLDGFVPWFSPITRGLTFRTWDLSFVAIVAVLAVATIVMLVSLPRLVAPAATPVTTEKNQLIVVVALMAGAALVFVVAGGYSLDSRKRYDLLPWMLWLATWVWLRLWPSRDRFTASIITGLAVVCTVGVATTWLLIGIGRYELERYHSLVEFLVRNQVGPAIRVEWVPDIRQEWPQITRNRGFTMDADWVLNSALMTLGTPPIRVVQEPGVPVVRYVPEAGGWQLVAAPTP